MSREIKFRQFAKGKMFYWGFNAAGDGSYFTGPVSGSGVIPDVSNQMQFTGLRDANGVDIYEGDIVKYKHTDINRGIIMFNTDNFAGLPAFHVCSKDGESVNYYYGVVADDSYIVIGNIYEHPHLLDEAK